MTARLSWGASAQIEPDPHRTPVVTTQFCSERDAVRGATRAATKTYQMDRRGSEHVATKQCACSGQNLRLLGFSGLLRFIRCFIRSTLLICRFALRPLLGGFTITLGRGGLNFGIRLQWRG